MKHWKYLKYVLRHKWFVFLACLKLRVPLWIAIFHDWDKFLPDEWFAYAEYFYGKRIYDKVSDIPGGLKSMGIYPKTNEDAQNAFDLAWMKHQHRNKHHWQYWLDAGNTPLPKTNILVMDDGWNGIVIDGRAYRWDGFVSVREPMPDVYRREMLADWIGAGKALGKPDTAAWYRGNQNNMMLHPETRAWIEVMLGSQESPQNKRYRKE